LRHDGEDQLLIVRNRHICRRTARGSWNKHFEDWEESNSFD
jgi:hypothetical protein